MAKEKKGKKHPSQLWKAYKVEGTTLSRVKHFSPKAQGSFMAEHRDRRTCGKTGYMEIKTKK